MKNLITIMIIALAITSNAQSFSKKASLDYRENLNVENEYDIEAMSGHIVVLDLYYAGNIGTDTTWFMDITTRFAGGSIKSECVVITYKKYDTHTYVLAGTVLQGLISIKFTSKEIEISTNPIPMSDSYVYKKRFRGTILNH